MAKANRFFIRGHHYHLTHRCHNGDIVDQASFKQSFEQDFNSPAFIEFYSGYIQEAIEADLQREPAWSESLAVGSREFVEEMSAKIRRRIRFDIHDSSQKSDRWILKEEGPLYS